MFFTESKPQGWRAVAVFEDRPELLLYLHRSSTQVRLGLRQAFFEVLDEQECGKVKSISLQRWHGAPDSGRWVHQTDLSIPVETSMEMAEKMAMAVAA